MQTSTSIRRRGGLSECPVFHCLFSFFFCFLCQRHMSHCASDLDQWELKTRRSAQWSVFWGSERFAPKFWG